MGRDVTHEPYKAPWDVIRVNSRMVRVGVPLMFVLLALFCFFPICLFVREDIDFLRKVGLALLCVSGAVGMIICAWFAHRSVGKKSNSSVWRLVTPKLLSTSGSVVNGTLPPVSTSFAGGCTSAAYRSG